jgi:hypothetical protein
MATAPQNELAEAKAKMAALTEKPAMSPAEKVSVAEPVKINAYPPIVLEGSPGGPFNINGEGFGTFGTLTIGGFAVKTTAWNDTRIKGMVPVGANGEVQLVTASGVRTGVYPLTK